MIIKLERYKEIGELLIENRTTVSWGHVCYQDGDWRVSVTIVAVHMGVKEMGCEQETGEHTISLQVGNESGHTHNCCRAIKKAFTCNNMEIDCKERGLEHSGPSSTNEVACQ